MIARLAMWLAYAVGVSNGQYVRYFTQRKLRSHHRNPR